MQRRVVITGIGTINPIGNSVQSYFGSLLEGGNGAGLITRFDTSLFKTKFACEVKNYDPAEYGIDKKEARRTDLFTQFALISTSEALKSSNLNLDECDKSRIGVVFGTGIGGIITLTNELINYAQGDGSPRFSPFLVPMMITNIVPGQISIKYGFTGPNFSTSSACASSAHAICSAVDMIKLGKADIMVTGGAEAPICIPAIGGFNSAKALSTNNDEYMTASRPFDKTRDGFVMGEGAAAFVLEDYEHAVARGAKIYAEVAGYGLTADAHHITAPHPEGVGIQKVMEDAMKEANVGINDVDYINLHGTSTILGDVVELKAIQNIFGEKAYNINLSSTKSMTGHLLGAAGAVELLACICALETGTIPPTINFKEEDPGIDYKLNLTLNKAQKRDVRVTMSNNFGFGGQNVSIVLKKI